MYFRKTEIGFGYLCVVVDNESKPEYIFKTFSFSFWAKNKKGIYLNVCVQFVPSL